MSRLRLIFAMLTVALAMAACESIDDERIPASPVRIVFLTVGEWNVYGVPGALSTQRFILSERIPRNFAYTAGSATGFGGVLLVCDYENQYRVYDLACPVERKATVRIEVDADELVGRCPTCGSTYDIFRYGAPLSGPALRQKFGLTRYRIGAGLSGEYMVITR